MIFLFFLFLFLISFVSFRSCLFVVVVVFFKETCLGVDLLLFAVLFVSRVRNSQVCRITQEGSHKVCLLGLSPFGSSCSQSSPFSTLLHSPKGKDVKAVQLFCVFLWATKNKQTAM